MSTPIKNGAARRLRSPLVAAALERSPVVNRDLSVRYEAVEAKRASVGCLETVSHHTPNPFSCELLLLCLLATFLSWLVGRVYHFVSGERGDISPT